MRRTTPQRAAFLASSHPIDVTAGTSDFVAGACLISAGLVTCALMATLAPHRVQAANAAAAQPAADPA